MLHFEVTSVSGTAIKGHLTSSARRDVVQGNQGLSFQKNLKFLKFSYASRRDPLRKIDLYPGLSMVNRSSNYRVGIS